MNQTQDNDQNNKLASEDIQESTTQPENEHGDKQFKPNTTVAAIVRFNNKYLIVEELENQQRVYNQPAGHLEANENLIDAVKRELLEETGLDLTPDYLSGIYYFYRPELNLYFMRFCFVFELDNKITQQLHSTPQDDEIIATHWFSVEQIRANKPKLRSAMVLDCIEDYLQLSDNKKIPLSALKTNL